MEVIFIENVFVILVVLLVGQMVILSAFIQIIIHLLGHITFH